MTDLSKLNDKQFAALWSKLITKIKEDPIKNFIRAAGFMNFSPTPAQTVALKIIFGQELDPFTEHKVYMETEIDGKFDLEYEEMTETQIFKMMTGRDYTSVAKVSEKVIINMIDLVVGRRGGKTTLSAMLAIYCAVSNNWKPYLQKTPSAHVLILSHSREFSDEVLELIRLLINESPILSRMVNKKKKNTTSTMNLSVPWVLEDGTIEHSRVQIKVGAASSKTVRGTAACAVLCDEIAYWNLDENLKETDEKIMKAVRPNMKQFGKLGMMIKLSSPGIKQGVLYGEYQKWQKGTLPKNYVVFKAPSWVWNTILPKEEFVIEWELDQDGFDTEYRSNFVDSLSNFILPEMVDLAVINGAKFQAPQSENENIKYFAAIDAAYKKDRFTFSVVGHTGNRITQFVSKGWEGSKKQPVKAKEVAKYIRQICKEFDIPWVAADQYSFQPLKEIFEEYGVTLEEYTFNPNFKKKIYFNLKKLTHSQQIDLLDNEIQTKEIKELIVEQSNAGSIRIGHPAGGTDDFADSLAIASYLATEGVNNGLKSDMEMSSENYGIKTDVNGNAFAAPSPDMLAMDKRYDDYDQVVDNASLYKKDPETGKLKRIEDIEDEVDDGIHMVT